MADDSHLTGDGHVCAVCTTKGQRRGFAESGIFCALFFENEKGHVRENEGECCTSRLQ